MSVSEALGERREVSLPQGTIRYRERGTGDPIVFIHGALVNADLWRKVVPLLAPDFRCIAPDLPLGSHELPMPDTTDLSPPAIATMIGDFLDALDLQNVTLVGNDTGGGLCQMLVTQRPDRVARLVLTNCDGFEVFPPKLFELVFATAKMPGGMFMLAQTMRFRPMRGLPIAYGWLSNGHPSGRSRTAGSTRCARTRACAGTPPSSCAACDKEQMLCGRAQARRLQAARCCWRGPTTASSRMELGRRIAAAFPDARIEEVQDSRTFVAEDQPERLSQLIASFIRQPHSEAVQTA